MPKVSVIMPIYNAGDFLRISLDSVCAQTLKDIEIVCVDDGSTDGSLGVMEEYAARDPRIRVLTGPNAGYGAAMNKGIAAACGEYVGVVEPDDFVDDVMFERLYEVAAANDCDVVKGDFLPFTGWGDSYHDQWYETAPYKAFYGPVFDSTRTDALFYTVMMTWEGIYRRNFLVENGIRHNETPGASFQDNGFWFQATALARRYCLINEAHYHYRTDNAGSSINSSASAHRIVREYALIREELWHRGLWLRLRHIYTSYYFDNLMARLEQTDEATRPELASFVAQEWLRSQREDDLDRNLLPQFLCDEFDLLAHDPAAYVPSEHRSITAESWAETGLRHQRSTLVSAIYPVHIIETYTRGIVREQAALVS